MTVGTTHSGKTTFAQALEQQLQGSVVIDQDNHAEFINTYYRALQPRQGPNTLKFSVTQTIVDYAVNQTDLHLILSNSNRARMVRLDLLTYFQGHGFRSILVHFKLPERILHERVANSRRSKSIFRKAASFSEVLDRQLAERNVIDPTEDEADHLFVIEDSSEVDSVIQSILHIVLD